MQHQRGDSNVELTEGELNALADRIYERLHRQIERKIEDTVDDAFEERFFLVIGRSVVKSFLLLCGAAGAAIFALVTFLQAKGVI